MNVVTPKITNARWNMLDELFVAYQSDEADAL